MENIVGNFTLRHPSPDDAQATLALMIACDVAKYGESDATLDDLVDQWSELDLNQDAWLVLTPPGQLIGYAAVFKGDHRFNFDVYAHPILAPEELTKSLLAQCEARACAQLEPDPERQTTASIIISEDYPADRQAAEPLGFKLLKYHCGMRITFETPPPAPVWPEGVTLRTAIPGQDDQLIYDFIQTAFDRPGRVPPSFEGWRDVMLGAYNFESELWFLAYHGDELIGAALCFDYPQYGWVRQLGVAQPWRRQGLGSALLQYVFGLFFKRGHMVVGLGVEAENQKAYHLYESVGMKRKQQYAEYSKRLSKA